ncbi:hypothetical protein [Dysgonomonas sp. Marseille-P4677]|uniref:hypothetical protein n=1 Tax=Dysgonomonas sp. Marseille-P4677 TaxID=2364790 RepID=UPI001F450AAD|nr:hypothetical protein [Dysgonomonas sp. Marseille-P4677]
MNTRLEELKSKPLALLTVKEFLELQQGQKQEQPQQDLHDGYYRYRRCRYSNRL